MPTSTFSHGPNVFIVGAPKCGTTSLFEYLAQHPHVFAPREKELFQFCDDLFPGKRSRSDAEYATLFAHAGEARITVEATPYYLYSSQAVTSIKTGFPEARIVVALRSPVDMMASLHAELVFHGLEPITNFADAISAELEGTRAPMESANLPRGFEGYLSYVRYARYLQRYIEAFGRSRVHTILLGDIVQAPERAAADLCTFLTLPYDGRAVPQVNRKKTTRFAALTAFLRNPPHAVRRIARTLLPPTFKWRIAGAAWRLNTVRHPSGRVPPELRSRILAELTSEIEATARLLDRDLSSWFAPR